MEKLNVAVIGVGIWGEMHVRVYHAHPKANLVAICDMNKAKAKSIAEKYEVSSVYTDYNEMLSKENIDAISVATPDFAHKAPVVASANAGKHIIVEKPFAKSVEECQEMIDAAKKAGVELMVDFHCRWVLPFMNIKNTVEAGELGSPQHAFIRLSDTMYVPRKMLSWTKETSPIWFLGCHTIDLLRWVFNDEVSRVYSTSQSRVLKSENINCPDYYQTILEFKRGGSAVMENSFLLPEKSSPALFDFKYEVVGENGAVFTNTVQSDSFAKYIDKPKDDPYYPKRDMYFAPSPLESLRGGALESIKYFVEVISKGGKVSVTGTDGLRATQVITAILESVKTGNSVKL